MATIYPGDNFSIEVTSFPEYNRVLSGVLSLGSQQIIYEVENALAPSLSIIGGG